MWGRELVGGWIETRVWEVVLRTSWWSWRAGGQMDGVRCCQSVRLRLLVGRRVMRLMRGMLPVGRWERVVRRCWEHVMGSLGIWLVATGMLWDKRSVLCHDGLLVGEKRLGPRREASEERRGKGWSQDLLPVDQAAVARARVWTAVEGLVSLLPPFEVELGGEGVRSDVGHWRGGCQSQTGAAAAAAGARGRSSSSLPPIGEGDVGGGGRCRAVKLARGLSLWA